MKILIVSNLYPPHFVGGYELRCAQVAEALRLSGHDVCVLTSTHGLPLATRTTIEPFGEELNGVRVYRRLHQYAFEPQARRRPWVFFQARHELQDASEFIKIVRTFCPDVINWWSMYGLSKLLLPLPSTWGIPDVHWIEHWWMIEEFGPRGELAADFWAKVWDGEWGPRDLRPLLRRAVHRWELRTSRQGIPTREFHNSPQHVCFVSEHMRSLHGQAGFIFPSSDVIYGGVPRSEFFKPVTLRPTNARLRLLYAGQLTPDRGLHTIIEALGCIVSDIRSQFSLSVAGDGGSPGYLAGIRMRVEELGLADSVTFLGRVAHVSMSQVHKDHDVLIFPSLRDEGLPLTMVEAMLAGCAVVTTGSGGAMEIAARAGLPLFPKDDHDALSQLLVRLAGDHQLLAEVADRGQRAALEIFTSDRMMERIQAMFLRVVSAAREGRQDGSTATLTSRRSFESL